MTKNKEDEIVLTVSSEVPSKRENVLFFFMGVFMGVSILSVFIAASISEKYGG